MKSELSILFSLGFCTLSQDIFLKPATAQVTTDGTTNTTVDVNGNHFTINQGDRAGSNLFHSFRDFSVPTLGSAFFNNAADIANIFSRVTGGNISNIDGLLRANGSANLFLLNPTGIIFGPNARLNIGGSFYGSSADSILFEDGEFSATDLDNPPLITINAPIGLNFRDDPGDIVNQSVVEDVGLEVSPGETLALIGGNIDSEGGQITAPGANVWLGGLSAPGTVSITDSFDLSIPDGIARADISFANGATVHTASNNGGGITVIGNSITLSEGSQLFGGIAENSGFDSAQAGDINVDATGAVNLSGDSSILNQVNSRATGNSGDINVIAQSLTLTEGSSLSASTLGHGNAGSVEITARDTITIDGEDLDGDSSIAASKVSETGVGNAGGVTIDTGSLFLTKGGEVSANIDGQGNGGLVKITARDTITIDGERSNSIISRATSQVGRQGVGNAGDVAIETGSLFLTNGGRVTANTSGHGNAGSVEITARDTITIDGQRSNDVPSAVTSLVVESDAVGDAGDVTIDTGSLTLTNGGEVNASTRGQGNAGLVKITADTIKIDGERSNGVVPSRAVSQVGETGTGDAEGVTITTGSLTLTNGGRVAASTFNQGNAGAVKITAETIKIDGEQQSDGDSSRIASLVRPDAVGNAGDVTIDTGSLTLTNGGEVSTSTSGQGNAGEVTITADTIHIDGETKTITMDGETTGGDSSGVFSTVNSDAKGKAGNITINANSIFLKNQGAIESDILGEGSGGNIFLKVGDDLNLDNGKISATNQPAQPIANPGDGSSGNIQLPNIQLQLGNNLILRNNSIISTEATKNANGGNITIDADFIIAYPSQRPEYGNDIIANAVKGNGGEINISAESLLNIQEGEAKEGNGTNDIDASSDFGAPGLVTINNPDSNTLQEVTPEPKIVESETLGVNACPRGRETEASTFIVKGKGGLPPLPTEPFMADALIPDGKPITINKNTDLTSPAIGKIEQNYKSPNYLLPYIKPIKTSRGDIYPARGIIKTEDGKIILTRYPTGNINTRTPQISANCGLLKDER